MRGRRRRFPLPSSRGLSLDQRAMLTDGTAASTPAGDEEIDSVTPRAAPAVVVEASTAGPNPLGLRAVRLFGEAGPCGPAGPATTSGETGAAAAALDFKLAAAVLRSGGGGGSGSDEDEVSEVRASEEWVSYSDAGPCVRPLKGGGDGWLPSRTELPPALGYQPRPSVFGTLLAGRPWT